MAFKSPGIYYTEIDNTEYTNPAAEVNTTVAIIGFAKKGPIGVPTEITTYNDFKSTFGSPISGQYAGLAVRSVLSAGGTVLYTRVADDTIASKSSVILKTSSDGADGMLVVNSKSNILVGSDGYENSTVYVGSITDDSDDSKTLVLRTPENGKFQLNEVLKQLNESLKESFGFTEYKLSSVYGSKRNFSLKVSGTDSDDKSVNTTYGPYFIDLYTGETGSAVADSLNQILENGTTPYQKMSLSELTTVNDTGTTTVADVKYNCSFLKETKYICVNNTSNKVPVSTSESSLTGGELAELLSTALAGQGITVEYCWTEEKEPYLLFISTNNKDFTILPYNVNGKKIDKTSMFVPYLDSDTTSTYESSDYVTKSEGAYILNSDATTSEDDIANAFKFGWNDPVIKAFAESAPVDVSYNEDTKSLIFTVKSSVVEADGSKVEVINSNIGKCYLFDTGAEADDTNAIKTALYTNNSKNIGYEVISLVGDKASTLSVKRNADGQIYFYKEGSMISPTYTDLTSDLIGKAKNISDIFGSVISEADFTKKELKSGEYKCMITKAGYAAVSSEVNDMVVFEAKEYGSGTTDIGIEIYTSYSPLDSSATHYIDLYVNGMKKESWEDVSYNPSDDNYFVTLMNKEADNGGSAYVTVIPKKYNTSTAELGVPDTAELTSSGIVYLGTAINSKSVKKTSEDAKDAYKVFDYAVGNDGIPSNTNDLFCDAMDKETSGLSNKELYSWHILITPDNITQEVQDEAISLCEYMEDAIYIADPPQGLSRKGVVNWHNGKSEYRDTALNSNFTCTYWPWCKVYDSSLKEYVWVMPSVIMAAQFCKVDKDYAPWYAPAGETNGYLSTVIDIESLPNKTDRDAMYLDQNRVNPLLKLRNGNILAYGEKTCQRKNSTLTKIHTRRMLIALKKELNAAIKGFIFQPTMAENISKIRANVQAIMEQYKSGGGVASYTVICDGTNNTTETLQQDILNIAISCVPVGCIEQVEITFTLNKSE